MCSFCRYIYFIGMFRSTSDYIVSAKSMAVFLLAASAQTMCTTALEVQSSAAFGYHGTVSEFYLSNIFNQHCLCEPVSDFSLSMPMMFNIFKEHGLLYEPISVDSLSMPMSNFFKKHCMYEPVSDYSLSMPMYDFFRKHWLYSENSGSSTLFGDKVNASHLASLLLLLTDYSCDCSQDDLYSYQHHGASLTQSDTFSYQSKALGYKALSVKEMLRLNHRGHWARELQLSSMQMAFRSDSALNTPLAMAIVYALGLFGYGTFMMSGTKRRSVLSTSATLMLLLAGPALLCSSCRGGSSPAGSLGSQFEQGL